MLDKLLDHCTEHRDYAQAISYGVRILRYDRAHERTHQSLMQLHFLAGDRTAALRQYETCVAALAEELDVAPSARTTEVWKAIRSGQFGGEATTSPFSIPPLQPALHTQPNALQFLQELHQSLTKMLVNLEEYLRNHEQTTDKQR
jgi:hypothetical protein